MLSGLVQGLVCVLVSFKACRMPQRSGSHVLQCNNMTEAVGPCKTVAAGCPHNTHVQACMRMQPRLNKT